MVPIKSWPVEDRPRERLSSVGARALSDAELLSLLFGSGRRGESAVEAARRFLSGIGGLSQLGRLDRNDLDECAGVGPAVASRVVAAVELGRRIGERRQSPERKFRSSRDIFEAYRHRLAPLLQEVFWVVVMDRRHRPIREICVGKGGLASCGVGPREVFRPAIQAGGATVVLLHNHPSGDPEPSIEDIEMSRRLFSAGHVLGIEILDHVVIASEGYASLRDLGLLQGEPGATTPSRHPSGRAA